MITIRYLLLNNHDFIFIFKFDYWMVLLMNLIIIFHADYYTLVNRDRVEKIQMKYIMILHRYLRYLWKYDSWYKNVSNVGQT